MNDFINGFVACYMMAGLIAAVADSLRAINQGGWPKSQVAFYAVTSLMLWPAILWAILRSDDPYW